MEPTMADDDRPDVNRDAPSEADADTVSDEESAPKRLPDLDVTDDDGRSIKGGVPTVIDG
jgi:hypothetical protein